MDTLDEIAAAWNRSHPIGAKVEYGHSPTSTRSSAYVMTNTNKSNADPARYPAIFIEGVSGCVPLDGLKPLDPPRPDPSRFNGFTDRERNILREALHGLINEHHAIIRLNALAFAASADDPIPAAFAMAAAECTTLLNEVNRGRARHIPE